MRPSTSLCTALLSLACGAQPAPSQVLRLADLNTRQIRGLDRSQTAVLLPGGMLEEHGPYLPAYTDGILSARLTEALADAIVAKKPGWNALIFPQVPFGSSGSNELGGHFVFPGTYTVRPATLRAVFMDLASELGEQGFRWILVVPRPRRAAPQPGPGRSLRLLPRHLQRPHGPSLGDGPRAGRLGPNPPKPQRRRKTRG